MQVRERQDEDVSSSSPIAVAYRMAAIFAVGGIVLLGVGAAAGYQFLGLGLIALLTAAGWVVKARRVKNGSWH